jgi:hypothetical protein
MNINIDATAQPVIYASEAIPRQRRFETFVGKRCKACSDRRQNRELTAASLAALLGYLAHGCIGRPLATSSGVGADV